MTNEVLIKFNYNILSIIKKHDIKSDLICYISKYMLVGQMGDANKVLMEIIRFGD